MNLLIVEEFREFLCKKKRYGWAMLDDEQVIEIMKYEYYNDYNKIIENKKKKIK